MFLYVNFLFLFSLVILSSTIWFYIQQIEQVAYANSVVSRKMSKQESPIMIETERPQVQRLSTTPSTSSGNIYVYSICTFICIYVLVKITHLAENYLAKSIRHSIHVPATSYTTKPTCSTVKSMETQGTVKLENQNCAMKIEPGVLKSQILMPAELERKSNIYICNKYIQLGPDIYLANRNIVDTKCEKGTVNQTDIWEKYMKLQNTYEVSNEAQHSVHIPVVISIEELEKIKGIY